MSFTENKSVLQHTELNRLVYVCSISGYNLPEFESCLLRRPLYLILVVSDDDKIQEAAERFARVVKSHLPGVHILRPDQHRKFNGTDLVDVQNWFNDILIPQLDALPSDLKYVGNLTGGTKVMALVLMTMRFNWDWLEYKADRVQQLQMIAYSNKGLKALDTEILPEAQPLSVARLYSEHVRENTGNIVLESTDSSCQAQKLWDGLVQKEPSLLALFGDRERGLEMLWMYGLQEKRFNKKWLEISASDFLGQATFSAAHLQWLQGWARLNESSLQVTEQSLKLAGNKNRRNELRRWLSGDWLEQLAYSWLVHEIPERSLTMNVSVRPENEDNSSTGERETDILVHYKGRTSLVEVKTDLPPGEKFSNATRQLASLLDRFGRTNKVLLIGPQLLQKNNKLDDLIVRCNAEGILLAHDKASLLYAVQTGKQSEPFKR